MKRLINYLSILVVLVVLSISSSCSSDDENNCGFAAVIEANEKFQAANQAISDAAASGGTITTELCTAQENAILDFETKAQAIDVDCLSEADAENLITWSLAVATTPPC